MKKPSERIWWGACELFFGAFWPDLPEYIGDSSIVLMIFNSLPVSDKNKYMVIDCLLKMQVFRCSL